SIASPRTHSQVRLLMSILHAGPSSQPPLRGLAVVPRAGEDARPARWWVAGADRVKGSGLTIYRTLQVDENVRPDPKDPPRTLAPRPFTLHVPDPVLQDLRARLAAVRWPDEAPGAPWSYGTSLAYMRGLVDHWRDRFDWRAQEARLNGLRQATVPL